MNKDSRFLDVVYNFKKPGVYITLASEALVPLSPQGYYLSGKARRTGRKSHSVQEINVIESPETKRQFSEANFHSNAMVTTALDTKLNQRCRRVGQPMSVKTKKREDT